MTDENYYTCACGGTFYVDLKTQSYGIYPCVYNYVCDECERRKSMPCLSEVQGIAKASSEFEMSVPVKRVYRF